MRLVSIIAADRLHDALENWIIDNKCNPTTPEEWERCINDLIAQGHVQPIGLILDEDVDTLKKNLKDNNVGEP